jgi:membrane associated rhomboid family serine protease
MFFRAALRVLESNSKVCSILGGASLIYSLDNNNNSSLSSLASRLLFSHYYPTLEEDLEKVVADAFGNSNSRYPSPSPSSPPSSHHTPPAIPGSGQAVINRLIAANSLVYIAWQLPYDSVKRIMERWFVTSPLVFQANRTRGWASLLLCTYSHSSFFHLLANMAGLYSFGPRIMQWRSSQQTPRLTSGEFMIMYTISGIFSSLASNIFMLRLGNPRPSLGASGAIFGVLTYYTLAQPDSRVLLLFIFNMRSIDALFVATAMNAVLCAQEVRASRMGTRGTLFDGMAHLGGTAVGGLFYYLAKERSKRRGEGSGSSNNQSGSIVARRSMRGGEGAHGATEI